MALPLINAYGVFTVLAPYTVDTGNYRCASLQLISVLADNGVDVFSSYYAPVGLTETNYQTDLAANASIVTLVPDNGDIISIPSSYILTSPNKLAVPYSQLVLSIDLGELPDLLSLTTLLSDVTTIVGDYVGVVPTARLHKIPITKQYSQSEHELKEAARLALVADYVSFYTANVNMAAELELARVKIADLEAAIIALTPP